MNIHELKELILKEPNQNLEVYGENLDDIIYISKYKEKVIKNEN